MDAPGCPTFEINGHGASVCCQFNDMHNKRKIRRLNPIGKLFGFTGTRKTHFWGLLYICAKIDVPGCPDF